MKFRPFLDIERQHTNNRTIAIVVVICSFVFSAVVVITSRADANKVIDAVLQVKAVIKEQQDNFEANRPAEGKTHVELMLNNILTCAPDKEGIEVNLKKASMLGDSTVTSFIKTLKEQKFYDKLIAASASSKLVFDENSFKRDFTTYPYSISVVAKHYIIRSSIIEEREISASMTLRNVPKTDNISQGFIAEKFFISSKKIAEHERN